MGKAGRLKERVNSPPVDIKAGVFVVVGVVLVNVSPGNEKQVFNALKGIEGVREILHVFGEYDFIAIVDVEGLSKLNSVVDEAREVDGVTSTQTIIGAEMPTA